MDLLSHYQPITLIDLVIVALQLYNTPAHFTRYLEMSGVFTERQVKVRIGLDLLDPRSFSVCTRDILTIIAGDNTPRFQQSVKENERYRDI